MVNTDARVETLFETEDLAIKKLVDPSNFIEGYEYLHEKKYKGNLIAVLPFKVTKETIELMLMRSTVPPWERLRQVTSSITGGVTGDAVTDVVAKIEELSNYVVNKDDLVPLGYCFASKSEDTKYSLYTVDLTNKEPLEEKTDKKSGLDALSKCYWADESILHDIWDPLVSVLYLRLLHLIRVNQETKDSK